MEPNASAGPFPIDSQSASTLASPLVPLGIPCRHCALDLKQQSVADNCPQCKKPIRDSLPGYTHNWKVGDSRPCLACGCDLIKQPLDGTCPKCHSPLIDSINGSLLRYSGHNYITSLHTGAKNICRAIICFFVIYALSWSDTLAYSINPALGELAYIVGAVLIVATLIVYAYSGIKGFWKLSAPDPRKLTRNTGKSTRLAIRVLLGIYVAVVSTAFVAATFNEITAIPSQNQVIFVIVLSVLTLSILLNTTLNYIQCLAYRIPSNKLRKLARHTGLMYKTAISGSFMVLLNLGFAPFLPQAYTESHQTTLLVATSIMIAGLLLGFIGFVLSLSMLIRSLELVLENTVEPTRPSLRPMWGGTNFAKAA